jgi:hypothetical protein
MGAQCELIETGTQEIQTGVNKEKQTTKLSGF